MLKKLAVSLLLGGCAATLPVHAGNTEKLLAEVPVGWIKRIDRSVGNLQLTEYYPADSLELWTQKLSIEVTTDSNLPDPLEMATGMADQQAGNCARFNNNTIFAGFENGYPTVVSMLQCGANKNTGRDVITMFKVIKGNESFYSITRYWRLDPVPAAEGETPEIAIDQAELGAWSQSLRKVTVCDTALAAHPCPDAKPVMEEAAAPASS